MQTVDYGFNLSEKKKDQNGKIIQEGPIGAFEGIGINDKTEGPVTAEFLGIIRYEGEDYLIGRTTMAFKNDPNYIGKITARRATADIYPNGSGTIFLDINENDTTRKLEKDFNSKNTTTESLSSMINHRYDSVVQGEEIYATSIKTTEFETKKMVNDSLDGHLDETRSKYY